MKFSAIKVTQPLGVFYIAKIPASELLNVAYSDEYQYLPDGSHTGSQRPLKKERLQQIANYIKTEEMCFPSSILIAFNYPQKENDDSAKPKFVQLSDSVYSIEVPDEKKSALVIDGQHRLNAFLYAPEYCRNIELVCSIFFDLPTPYQAYLFATINGNQVKVSKSLALEFFGYNLDNEPRDQWTPEKLAVYLTRKLNFKNDSPLYHKLKLAAEYEQDQGKDKMASTAAIVEGILSLISSNPQLDRDVISKKNNSIFTKKNRSVLKNAQDKTPLRSYYLEVKDDAIYNILVTYFNSVWDNMWKDASPKSIVLKTVGVLALFDLLKSILLFSKANNITPDNIDFSKYMAPLTNIDFSNDYFTVSSLGRGRMKRIIKYLSGIKQEDSLQESDREFLSSLNQNN